METKKILKYRSIWMAVAILWIFFFHLPFDLSNLPILKAIRLSGYGGVDIFFFASGIGCYLSYTKDENTPQFIMRRLKKIMPMYLCFIPLWLILTYRQVGYSISDIIGNLSGIQYLTTNGHEFNWYISALLAFYILTPVLASFVKQNKLYQNLLITVLLLVLSFSFWNSNLLIICASRLPIYYLGLTFGKIIKTKKKISGKSIALLLGLSVLGCISAFLFNHFAAAYLWSRALYWYPFILIVPGLCVLISIIADKISTTKIGAATNRFFSFLGQHTLELYFIHFFTIQLYLQFFIPVGFLDTSTASVFALLALILIFTVIFYYYYKLIMFLLGKAKAGVLKLAKTKH